MNQTLGKHKLNRISKTVAYTQPSITRHISCHLRQMLRHSHVYVVHSIQI